ncbi:MAG: transcriptional regulator [Planctomycetaceae bacterium]
MTPPEPTRHDDRPSESTGRFAYDGLDRVIHEKARLGIITSLAAHPEGLIFAELKELCALTDGNLSRHLQVLEDAELVEIWKKTHGNRPQTLVRLTELGRQRFLEYIEVLERVVADALHAVPAERDTAAKKRFGTGWSPA